MPRVIRTLPAPDFTKGHFPLPGAPQPVKSYFEQSRFPAARPVFANNFPIAVGTDIYEEKIHGTHPNTRPIAAATVFVNNVPVHKAFDLTTCGDIALGGITTVFVHGPG
jgi:hypothetical protein